MAQSAYNRALDLLAARAYTVRDLRRKLVQKEVPEDEVDAVVQRLLGAGLLDDDRYALSYARSKLTAAGSSRRRVQQELERKGVPASVARDAVDQVMVDEEIDTRSVVERVARRKLISMGDLDPVVRRRRLYAFLARRGHELDEIQSVIRDLGA